MEYSTLQPWRELDEHGVIYEAGSLYTYFRRISDPRRQTRLIDAEGMPVNLFIRPGETVICPNVYYLGAVKVNLMGYWQKRLSQPLWIITSLEPERGLEIYQKRMKGEAI